MMGNVGRGDNIMREMAREVNLLEHERKHDAAEELSQSQRKKGQIILGIVACVLVFIIALFILL